MFAGITMDNQLVSDLFSNTRAAAQVLNLDKQFCDTILSLKRQLPPMQVGQYGQLQEWFEDWDNPNDHHRHISHLWGFFPGYQISPYSSPVLFEAARNTLIQRGDPSTGWSMGWKVCFWARCLDGNHAFKLITNQLNLVSPEVAERSGRGTYPNLFDAHPLSRLMEILVVQPALRKCCFKVTWDSFICCPLCPMFGVTVLFPDFVPVEILHWICAGKMETCNKLT